MKEITRLALEEAVKELTFLRQKLYTRGEKTLYTTNSTIDLVQGTIELIKKGERNEKVH